MTLCFDDLLTALNTYVKHGPYRFRCPSCGGEWEAYFINKCTCGDYARIEEKGVNGVHA